MFASGKCIQKYLESTKVTGSDLVSIYIEKQKETHANQVRNLSSSS